MAFAGQSVKIAYSASHAPLTAGDFGGFVTSVPESTTLWLPATLKSILAPMDIRTGAELYSAISIAPTYFIKELGWQKQDVDAAQNKLADTLRGYVPDALLQPPPAKKTFFGAKPPRP